MTSAVSSARLMWAGFLGIFVWGSIAGLLGAVLPGLRERSGLSLTQSGLMFVALSTGLVLGSVVAGPALDRYGAKRVLCTAVGLVVAGLLAFEVVLAFPWLLLPAMTMGAGGSAVVTGAHALVAELNPTHRAASLNLLDFFFGVGAFVTPFALVPLQTRGGVTAVLLALALLASGVLAYLVATRFPPPRGAAHTIAGAGRVVRSTAFLLPALLIFLYVGTEQSIWDWQVSYLGARQGLANVEAARALSIFPIAIMIGRLVNNRVLMALPPAPVLLVSTAGAAASLAVVMLTHSGAVATGALFVAGLFMASVYPTTLGVLAGRFTGASGAALGLAITCGWLGSVVISPSLGFVAEHRDFATAYTVVVASAAAMLLTATALSRQREGAAAPDDERSSAVEWAPGD
jgi:MFS transporter, FHS family, glucose/mannose:H+ symporter